MDGVGALEPGGELPGYPQFRTFTLDEDAAFHLVCLEGAVPGGGGSEHALL
jgi:hypothetical protein